MKSLRIIAFAIALAVTAAAHAQTTFTANLAEDIAQNLDKLLDGAARKRVEVIHIDAWVARFLKANGYDYTIAYWPELPASTKTDWENAVAITQSE